MLVDTVQLNSNGQPTLANAFVYVCIKRRRNVRLMIDHSVSVGLIREVKGVQIISG